MFFDDAFDHGKPEPGTFLFAGHIRLKQPPEHSLGKTGTVVLNAQLDEARPFSASVRVHRRTSGRARPASASRVE